MKRSDYFQSTMMLRGQGSATKGPRRCRHTSKNLVATKAEKATDNGTNSAHGTGHTTTNRAKVVIDDPGRLSVCQPPRRCREFYLHSCIIVGLGKDAFNARKI